MVWMVLGWVVLWIQMWLARKFRRTPAGRGRKKINAAPCKSRQKPAWVIHEIIRLKALMPGVGCRTIAIAFNRRYAVSHQMTVGRTFVSDTLRRHRYEIEVMRREIKHRVPRPVPRNLVWAMDLTGKGDAAGNMHIIFGIIDHGTRALLTLAALPNKASWTLLGYLFLAIGKYGEPRAIRTDNEACFTSRLFGTVLMLSGIRHQRSDPHCPLRLRSGQAWQNGWIERLFGTLKQKLDQREVAGFEVLNVSLDEFRFFYNVVRPHQHLGGRTPHEEWHGVDPFTL